MSNRKKTTASFPPMVGGSSLLVIFAVLCLTIFTLLTLSTVKADERLLSSSAVAITSYYEADTRAEEIFAEIRASVSEHQPLPDGVTKSGSLYSYSCPISDTQELIVQLQQDHSSWTVLTWQARSTITHDAEMEN